MKTRFKIRPWDTIDYTYAVYNDTGVLAVLPRLKAESLRSELESITEDLEHDLREHELIITITKSER
jgi:hypothetical protein